MAVTMLQTLLGILQHELTNFDVKSPEDHSARQDPQTDGKKESEKVG